jgi:uncharacterized protein
MSEHQLLIEPEPFARARRQVSGRFSATELGRIGEALFDRADRDRTGDQGTSGRADAVRFTVRGFVNPRDQAVLELDLEFDLTLRCQRCLGPLRFEQSVRRGIVLAPGLNPFELEEEEDQTVDVVPFVARLDLKELIEEEVVLSLPLAPVHAGCQLAGSPEPARDSESTSFSVLAKLKPR